MSSIYSRMAEQADQLAKDRVERNAEIARLKAENQRLRETVRLREESQIPMIPHGAQQKIERLEAENQRLREALERVAALKTWDGYALEDANAIAHTALQREALAGDGE